MDNLLRHDGRVADIDFSLLNRPVSSSDFRFALIATGDAWRQLHSLCDMNEDWLAVIVGLALLALVLVGAIPGSVIP